MPEHGHGHGGNMTPEQQKAMIEQEMRLYEQMGKVKYKIAVMSGKGGVGKSTVAANLAEAFQKKGMVTESWMLIFMAQTYLSYSAWKARK